MKDITLSIPDKEYSFFITLMKHLKFVQIKETQSTQNIESIPQLTQTNLKKRQKK